MHRGFAGVTDEGSWGGDYEVDGPSLETPGRSLTPRTRTAAELTAALKAAGGTLVVNANSSELIVAVNNRMSFQIEQDPSDPTKFRISPSNVTLYLLGGGALLLLAALVFFE